VDLLSNVTCPDCGLKHSYTYSDTYCEPNRVYVDCIYCGTKIQVAASEEVTERKPIEEEIPVLETGTVVRVTNEQHVWHNQIGIIKDKKHKHYRIEIFGALLWVPSDWVEEHELNDANP